MIQDMGLRRDARAFFIPYVQAIHNKIKKGCGFLKKGWKFLTAWTLILGMVPVPVYAEVPSTMYLGDVASISAKDLVVNSNYVSLDELTKEYNEERSKQSSNNTNVQSQEGKISGGNTLINGLVTDKDLSGNLPGTIKKTLSYEEFMDLIAQNNATAQEKYKQHLKAAQDKQRKGTEAGAKEIQDAIKKAMNGINPVTGEAMDTVDYDDMSDFYKDLQAFWDNAKGWYVNNDPVADKAELTKEAYDDFYNTLRKEFERIAEVDRGEDEESVKNGYQDMVETVRLDESEYINDELVLDFGDGEDQYNGPKKGEDGANSIKYRCATCGKTYSQVSTCDCGKLLSNKIYKFNYDRSANILGGLISKKSSGFRGFEAESEPDADGNTNYLILGNDGPVQCELCGKLMTSNAYSFKCDKKDKFYYDTSANFICGECYEKMDQDLFDSDHMGSFDENDKWYPGDQLGSGSGYYIDNVAIPVKLASATSEYVDEMMPFEEDPDDYSNDAIFEAMLERVDDEETKQKMRDAKAKYEDAVAKLNFPGSDEEKDALQKMYDLYAKGLKNAGYDIPTDQRGVNGWTEDEIKKFKEALQKAADNGIPKSGSYGKDIELIKDTDEYKNAVNTIFGDWPRDQTLWTSAQKKLYEEFVEKYGKSEEIRNTLQELIDKGVISSDKSADEIINGIDDYIAGFTSISDDITVNVMLDISNYSERTQGTPSPYQVQGGVKVSVYDPDGGTVVKDYTITDSFPFRFQPDKVGKYKIKRTVQIYDVEWKVVTAQYDIQAVLEFPDGTSETLTSKTVTRIREDKSGFKTSNMKTVSAPDITVNVLYRELDINKQDFYDTERIS